EARAELLHLAAVLEQLGLELAVLRLERGLRVLRLAQLLLRFRELLALLLERRLDLLELLLLREVGLAQVQELGLAAAALRRHLGLRTRALELVLELADLSLELADLAQRLAVVHAGLLGLGVLRELVEPEVDRGLRAGRTLGARVVGHAAERGVLDPRRGERRCLDRYAFDGSGSCRL